MMHLALFGPILVVIAHTAPHVPIEIIVGMYSYYQNTLSHITKQMHL